MSIVGIIVRKVTAETSSEGVMAGVGVVEVNPCVFTFISGCRHEVVTDQRGSRLGTLSDSMGSTLVECIEDTCKEQNLACATWMIPS